MIQLPEDLKSYIKWAEWTYAKTMPKWPHEYLVSTQHPLVAHKIIKHINDNARAGRFYNRTVNYYDEDGYTYWVMPAERGVVIINRCKKEQTYEERAKRGELPED